MDRADRKLRQGADTIFDKENTQNNSFAGSLTQKRIAEDERLKGNEFMKSKEYSEA